MSCLHIRGSQRPSSPPGGTGAKSAISDCLVFDKTNVMSLHKHLQLAFCYEQCTPLVTTYVPAIHNYKSLQYTARPTPMPYFKNLCAAINQASSNATQ